MALRVRAAQTKTQFSRVAGPRGRAEHVGVGVIELDPTPHQGVHGYRRQQRHRMLRRQATHTWSHTDPRQPAAALGRGTRGTRISQAAEEPVPDTMPGGRRMMGEDSRTWGLDLLVAGGSVPSSVSPPKVCAHSPRKSEPRQEGLPMSWGAARSKRRTLEAWAWSTGVRLCSVIQWRRRETDCTHRLPGA